MKCRHASLKVRIIRGCGHEHTDKAHPLALLRTHGERRDRHRAAGKSYEIAPPQDRSHSGQGIILARWKRAGCGSLGGKAFVQDRSLAGRPTYVLSFLQSADIGGSWANVRFVLVLAKC